MEVWYGKQYEQGGPFMFIPVHRIKSIFFLQRIAFWEKMSLLFVQEKNIKRKIQSNNLFNENTLCISVKCMIYCLIFEYLRLSFILL